MDRNQLLNDTEVAIRYGLDGRQAEMWTSLPCIIQSVDNVAMTVEAQPAVQGIITNPDDSTDYVDLPLLVDVPICFPNGGGFALTFPLVEGDEVLVILASRAIDSWWQNGGTGNIPVETRMHDLSDGFAIPGPRSQPRVVPSISTSAAQLRNQAGTAYVGINGSGLIQFASPTKNLSGVLNGMIDLLTSLENALTTFATAASADPLAVVVAAAAVSLAASLATLIPQANAYKTSDVGALTP